MIYLVDSEQFESFLREAVMYEKKWNKKHGIDETKPKEKKSYIDHINSH